MLVLTMMKLLLESQGGVRSLVSDSNCLMTVRVSAICELTVASYGLC